VEIFWILSFCWTSIWLEKAEIATILLALVITYTPEILQAECSPNNRNLPNIILRSTRTIATGRINGVCLNF